MVATIKAGGFKMEKLINEIISKFNCNKDDAMEIINNAITKSNVAQLAIKNAIKKEYEL